MYYHFNMDNTFINGGITMYFKSFDKLDMNIKIKILSELGLLYDLNSDRGINALKKEFKHVEPQIKGVMIEKGLYKR